VAAQADGNLEISQKKKKGGFLLRAEAPATFLLGMHALMLRFVCVGPPTFKFEALSLLQSIIVCRLFYP
jgi:hypothetical protein